MKIHHKILKVTLLLMILTMLIQMLKGIETHDLMILIINGLIQILELQSNHMATIKRKTNFITILILTITCNTENMILTINMHIIMTMIMLLIKMMENTITMKFWTTLIPDLTMDIIFLIMMTDMEMRVMITIMMNIRIGMKLEKKIYEIS